MLAVNGYYENGVCIPTETLDIKEKQRVIITILDEEPLIKQDASVAMKLFGTLTHDEAKSIRDAKLHFKES
jgi:predicted DNA-binding antitoxin AbrB/MazE fold protein